MAEKLLKKRSEIDNNCKWKLEDIYASNDAWEKDYTMVEELTEKIVEYKGKLSESVESLYNCLKLSEEIAIIMQKLFVYARMRRDEDNADSFYQKLASRAMNLYTKVSAADSFIYPEITSIEDEKLKAFMQDQRLLQYKHYMDDLLRRKKHILSDREEEILAQTADLSSASREIFTMFNNADISFGTIKDETNDDVELTHGNYVNFMKSYNRDIRKSAFSAMYVSYEKMSNTLATTYTSSLKKDWFYAKMRKYSSCVEYSLDDDNVNVSVYDNLIDTVNSNLGAFHKYMELRGKALKLDELHLYDIYVPIVQVPHKEISFNEAKEILLEALKPLGEEYINDLKQAFDCGWIDIYENKGKTSGAYSWGEYTVHPYVLLNYTNTIDDLFTLAHELGHAMHSYYTNKTQPFTYSNYKLFVAEVASTVNEMLLMDYLLKTTTDEEYKAYLLNHYLEEFRGTVFRQTMFAEYEKIVHEKIEKNEPLNKESLSEIYYDLNKKYFGSDVIIDDAIKMEWSRIPHFYRAFYVYKYSIGLCSAVSIVAGIMKDNAAAVPKYLNFLSGGDSDYPINLLKGAGVDLTTPKPIQDGIDKFSEVVDMLLKRYN